jgi:hypothetical protein
VTSLFVSLQKQQQSSKIFGNGSDFIQITSRSSGQATMGADLGKLFKAGGVKKFDLLSSNHRFVSIFTFAI